MEPITLQGSAPNLLNVVFLPHMPESWGTFFYLRSPQIKLTLSELELKSLRKIFNLSSLKSFWFSEIHSSSAVFIYFEFEYCVNNITLLEWSRIVRQKFKENLNFSVCFLIFWFGIKGELLILKRTPLNW